jgi:hypothetical protein
VLASRTQPTVEDYMQLKYLMRCVNESMRLYPHPPVLLRRAQVADTLPGTPYSSRSTQQRLHAVSCAFPVLSDVFLEPRVPTLLFARPHLSCGLQWHARTRR